MSESNIKQRPSREPSKLWSEGSYYFWSAESFLGSPWEPLYLGIPRETISQEIHAHWKDTVISKSVLPANLPKDSIRRWQFLKLSHKQNMVNPGSIHLPPIPPRTIPSSLALIPRQPQTSIQIGHRGRSNPEDCHFPEDPRYFWKPWHQQGLMYLSEKNMGSICAYKSVV